MKIQEVRALQLQARKSGNKPAASLYTLVMGEYDTAKKAGRHNSDDVDQIVQKLLKSNAQMIAGLKTFDVSDSKEQYENELLTRMLPKMASTEEVHTVLSNATYSTIPEALAVLVSKFGNNFDKKSAVAVAQKTLGQLS